VVLFSRLNRLEVGIPRGLIGFPILIDLRVVFYVLRAAPKGSVSPIMRLSEVF